MIHIPMASLTRFMFTSATRCVTRSERTAFQPVRHTGQAEKKSASPARWQKLWR